MNHCDSFASKVNQMESESKIKLFAHVNQRSNKVLIHPAYQNLFVIFDSLRRIKHLQIKIIDSVRALFSVIFSFENFSSQPNQSNETIGKDDATTQLLLWRLR